MTRRRRQKTPPASAAKKPTPPDVAVREVSPDKRRSRRGDASFPGPRGVDVALRIAFVGAAFAELIAQAKTSLDAEICGVLVGRVHRDDEGPFVLVEATIHGEEAREGSTHVTFTQETWVHIHETLERDHPEREIVGWYHTHPGFGVEFSEMDLFVHQNFFPSATQIALLTDPLSGEIAVLVNAGEATARLDRFWVDHREVRCQVPAREPAPADSPSGPSPERLKRLEEKLDQFLRHAEEQRNELMSWLVWAGVLIVAAILFWIGSGIYGYYMSDRGLPNLRRYESIPVVVELEGKTVILEAHIVGLEVPNDRGPQSPPAPEAADEAPGASGSGWRRYRLPALVALAAVIAVWAVLSWRWRR